jgi:hypothetical protein
MWRAGYLITPCLADPVDYSFASRHKGHGFKPQGSTYVKSGFLLLVTSHYICDPDVILISGFRCPSLGPLLGLVPTM